MVKPGSQNYAHSWSICLSHAWLLKPVKWPQVVFCPSLYRVSSQCPSELSLLILVSRVKTYLLKVFCFRGSSCTCIFYSQYRYVRALGAMYMRLVGTSMDCYNYLEPLYNDYRKIRRRNKMGSEFSNLYLLNYLLENCCLDMLSCGVHNNLFEVSESQVTQITKNVCRLYLRYIVVLFAAR